MLGVSFRMESTNLWNDWAEFCIPIDSLRKLNRPQGVVIQVLCRSLGSMTIWWNALAMSTLEKMFEPAILAVNDLKFGRG